MKVRQAQVSVLATPKPVTIYVPLEIYRPSDRRSKRELGSKRLVTFEAAAKFLGIPFQATEFLSLRSEEVDGKRLLYAQSVEAYKAKMA